jgi:Ca-activated chloride channel family protein
MDTEAYARIDETGFLDPRRVPLSTFSVDVDTASYANTRRFLNDGRLPPKDAVRIEEFLNYFAYDYARPKKDGPPFSIQTEVGPCPWAPQHRLVLVGLQGRTIDDDDLPPRNLVFLIDVSGSMNEPRKLPLLKSALSLLARRLTAKDSVAIVVYAGSSGLVLPPTGGDKGELILRAIAGLEADGSTNGAEGIQLAYRTAEQAAVRGAVNRVILATDGDFNVGVTNMGALTRLIEEKRETGIFLSVLGFGDGNLKDSTMEMLADRGNGNYSYIDTVQEARKVLVREAGGTLVTIAKDVKLQVELNPRRVAGYRLLGYENRRLRDEDFKDDRKDAGEIGAGHRVTALYEIVPPGGAVDTGDVDPLKYQPTPAATPSDADDELLTVKLRYKEPDGDESQLLSHVVKVPASERLESSMEYDFATAVAEFALLLRDSEHKERVSFESVLERARRCRGTDKDGDRAEFARLVALAETLALPPQAAALTK